MSTRIVPAPADNLKSAHVVDRAEGVDGRRLLARISRWRRTDPDGLDRRWWPGRWEQSFWPGWYRTFDGLTEVCWAEDRVPADTLHITWREGRYGPEREARITVTSLRQAVDVLVAVGILPVEVSSAYEAGCGDAAQRDECEGAGR